jgi:hypothetical protein
MRISSDLVSLARPLRTAFAKTARPAAPAPVTDPAPAATDPMPVPAATDPFTPTGPSTLTDPVVPVASPEPTRAHGVLRNLAIGHYRGVADLRLRANFEEEIRAAGLTLPPPPGPRVQGKAYARLQPAPPGESPGVDEVA